MWSRAALVLLALVSTAQAQWSPDSTANLQICDLTGEQVLPKIASTSDGGCFISWFDQRSGSYCVYLQRLDYQGNPQFPDGGILVSDLPQQSWITDYGMAVDGEDNAVIVFSDQRNEEGELDVSAYMVSGTGDFLWGSQGICLSDTSQSSFEASPVVAVTGEGNCIFAWTKETSQVSVVMQKLSPEGTPLWGEWGITLSDPSADLSSPVVVPSGADSAIVMWKRSTGSYPMTVTHLYADMFDVNGSGIWGDTPVLIYDGGAITPWTFPAMIPDGSGGAVCSWYDSPSLSDFNVWVQHLDDQGNALYPFGGAQASTNSTDRLHMSPSAGIDPATEDCFVFWTETNGNQDQWGLYGQKFDASGIRQWTDGGLELIPLGGEQISFAGASVDPSGIYVTYLSGSGASALRAMRLDFQGSVVWGPVTLSAGSLGEKDDPFPCYGHDSSLILAWTDKRNDNGGIYAQNIMLDGGMGQFMGVGEAQGSGPVTVSVSPNPSRGMASITVAGSCSQVSLDVYDLSGRLVDRLLNGTEVSGEETVSWTPRGTAAGVYILRLRSPGGETSRRLVMLR